MIRTRRAPLRAVFLVVAAQGIVLWGSLSAPGWIMAVTRATGGWVNPNLPGGALVFLLSVVPFVFIRARLRPRDIGLTRVGLLQGLALTAALWAALQLGLAAAALLDDGALRLARIWTLRTAPQAPLAYLAAMLVVMPGLEEATYRGFVLPQLWLRLRGSPRVRAWGAIAGSAALFALIHLPNRHLLQGLAGAGLATSVATTFLAGIFYAVIYLRTASLWATGGIHALMNAPTPLVEPVVPPVVVLVPLVLALVVAWPRVAGGAGRPLRAGTRIEVEGHR